ncbi:uncharacterized protein EKO05_0007635 [Ascochyta rabiei]|uniref:uncharacterized protein n=1 Tax=Didymella rabiei TaxID=5454 RepID=UPI0019005C84|nr:uncharacterized protein EKO05_0007635 [Ascochyta rabiei]UPX17269.1 hypothetical protein EKO05_0007635 [Ascochyta rabiei]
MNNYSFLDSTGNVAMPRSAPSPSPSPASPMNGAPQQNGIPMVNGLPSGGQQTDMNHLWGVVQQLSQILEENKAQTQGVLNGVQALQQRAAEEGGIEGSRVGAREVNGEINAASRAAELTTLQSRLTAAESTIHALETSTASLTSLVTDYENALTLLLDKLRPYAYNQTTSILALHKHYQSLLEQERSTSMQLRLEHAEWQAGLGRVAEHARQALKLQTQAEEPLVAELRCLKEENRVLRRLAGWEEKPAGSDDDDDDDDEKA